MLQKIYDLADTQGINGGLSDRFMMPSPHIISPSPSVSPISTPEPTTLIMAEAPLSPISTKMVYDYDQHFPQEEGSLKRTRISREDALGEMTPFM